MARFRATLAYDGTAYQGFQRQAASIPTIQGAVEQAITTVTGQTTTVIGAGRTDSGVHATGQVIAFDCRWQHTDAALLRAINANMPDDIALRDIRQQEGFHPRFDAKSRQYRYWVMVAPHRHPLLIHYAWQVSGPLHSEAMAEAAALLVGEHDFATFGQPPQGDNTVREVYVSRWEPRETQFGAALTYKVEATAFLQHMVRRIVGMLVRVGRGIISVAEFMDAFQSANIAQARVMAPPQGLVLEAVRYQDTIGNRENPVPDAPTSSDAGQE